jgi:hypothetical protein
VDYPHHLFGEYRPALRAAEKGDRAVEEMKSRAFTGCEKKMLFRATVSLGD